MNFSNRHCVQWCDASMPAWNHFNNGTKSSSSLCLGLRVLQRSPVRPGSSWRCRLSSAPSARRGATPSAAASALTNGIPCLLDSVAWQPRWRATPTETAGSAATGLRGGCGEGQKLGFCENLTTIFARRPCSSSWLPQGNYLMSNRDECTVSLIYAVHLKKQGSVSFEYQYPDNNLLFEFFVSLLLICFGLSPHLLINHLFL